MKTLRIAIEGINSTGKTTLTKNLAQHIDLPIIKDMVRTVAKMLNISGDNPSLSYTQRVEWMRGVLWWQIEFEETLDYFISDESLFTFWAYNKIWFHKKGIVDTFEKIVEQQANKYTHVIYLSPVLPHEKNGFRRSNLIYQNKADQMIRKILKDWFEQQPKKLKVIEQVPLNNRVRECLSFLNLSPSV